MFEEIQKSIDAIILDIERAIGNKNPIEEVIFNDPVTVVNWADGKKTIVRCQAGDTYDKRTGLLLCIAKRMFGNKGKYNDVLNKWCPEEEQEASYDRGQDGGTDEGF